MARGTLEALYEMAASETQVDPITGVPKFDEQKLRKELAKNNTLGRRNRDVFEQHEPKYKKCPRYNPCPICDKCMNKASHLYVACQTCQIPICSHSYADRDKMIKRENFIIFVEKDTMDAIRELDRMVTDSVCI